MDVPPEQHLRRLPSRVDPRSATSGRYVHNQGEGVAAYVARDDCAAAAAAVLVGDGHDFVPVDDAAYTDILMEYGGLPADLAAAYATFGTGVRGGHAAVVSNAVERLTGRPATRFADVVAASVPMAA